MVTYVDLYNQHDNIDTALVHGTKIPLMIFFYNQTYTQLTIPNSWQAPVFFNSIILSFPECYINKILC